MDVDSEDVEIDVWDVAALDVTDSVWAALALMWLEVTEITPL